MDALFDIYKRNIGYFDRLAKPAGLPSKKQVRDLFERFKKNPTKKDYGDLVKIVGIASLFDMLLANITRDAELMVAVRLIDGMDRVLVAHAAEQMGYQKAKIDATSYLEGLEDKLTE